MNTPAQFTRLLACARPTLSATVSAYIDPSAMTYMIQLAAGVAIAAGAGFSFYLRKLKRKFSKGRGSRADVQSFASLADDDDIGYGDYELEPADPQPQASPSPAAERACAPEPVTIPATPADPFDETGGEGGLAAENRELRRLLAEERKKVEELKRALHICTAPRK